LRLSGVSTRPVRLAYVSKRTKALTAIQARMPAIIITYQQEICKPDLQAYGNSWTPMELTN
jgi:hypothetical protein